MIDDIGGAASRRKGKALGAGGVMVGGLGLVMVVWAAEPLISPFVGLVGVIVENLGPLPAWDVPGWVVKLVVASVLFSVAGLMMILGGWRWGVGTLRARRHDASTRALPVEVSRHARSDGEPPLTAS